MHFNRGRPKGKKKKKQEGDQRKTWLEMFRSDLEICNLIEEISLTRVQWRDKIHVADSI